LLLLLLLPAFGGAQQGPSGYPQPFEGDWNVPDFTFRSGETLAPLRLHYITLGSPARDGDGRIRNAVLILHGPGGAGQNFLASEFGGELFGKGQPLDATRTCSHAA
jgi:homoserine O-acetyltransferase